MENQYSAEGTAENVVDAIINRWTGRFDDAFLHLKFQIRNKLEKISQSADWEVFFIAKITYKW